MLIGQQGGNHLHLQVVVVVVQEEKTLGEEVQEETEEMQIGEVQPEDQQEETGEDLELVEDAEGEVEEEVVQEIR